LADNARHRWLLAPAGISFSFLRHKRIEKMVRRTSAAKAGWGKAVSQRNRSPQRLKPR
jgi:hypothetical protein